MKINKKTIYSLVLVSMFAVLFFLNSNQKVLAATYSYMTTCHAATSADPNAIAEKTYTFSSSSECDQSKRAFDDSQPYPVASCVASSCKSSDPEEDHPTHPPTDTGAPAGSPRYFFKFKSYYDTFGPAEWQESDKYDNLDNCEKERTLPGGVGATSKTTPCETVPAEPPAATTTDPLITQPPQGNPDPLATDPVHHWNTPGLVRVESPVKDQYSTLCLLINAIVNIIAEIGGIIAVLCIVWSGFLFVKAQGNQTQITEAKRVFMGTIIGTAILMGATVITKVVFNTISAVGRSTNTVSVCQPSSAPPGS